MESILDYYIPSQPCGNKWLKLFDVPLCGANDDGVITYLEPDILECEVKWALGSITTNKASGGDRIQLSYFKS